MKGTIGTRSVAGRECEVYLPAACEGAPLFFAALGDLADIAAEVEKQRLSPCVLFAQKETDWDREFSPWPALERFSGDADETVRFVETALCELESELHTRGRFVTGYSLGGLFALYCLFSGMELDGAASVSGSMWYPHLMEYVRSRPLPEGVCYLSLGKQEAKIHAKEMAGNAENAQEIARLFWERGFFEWNNGNHFYEVPQRVVKSIKFMSRMKI